MTLVDCTYDARNRLTAADNVTYTYDAENNRLSQSTQTPTGNSTTFYTTDPHGSLLPSVLIKHNPDGTKTYYIYGIGLVYQVTFSTAGTESNPRYYHYDHLGSTLALTDATGTETEHFDYSEYGHLTKHEILSGTTVNTPFLYVGQFGIQTDPNSLHYMRARYYNPLLMRFINADPIGFVGGSNWYAYAGNNPMSYIDISGLCPSKQDNRAWYNIAGDAIVGTASAVKNWVGNLTYADVSYYAKASIGPWLDVANNIGAGLGWTATKAIQMVRSPLDGNRFWETGGEYWTKARDPFQKMGWYAPSVGNEVIKTVAEVGATFYLAGGAGSLQGGVVSSGSRGMVAARNTTPVIGRVNDLQKIGPGEKSLLDRLPNLGNPKANWQQNSGVLRQEMNRGLPIRDASPNDVTGVFLNAERNLLQSRGWVFDKQTNLWMPPK